MKSINLINKEKSDIKYNIFRFPDGEIQIELLDIDRKEDYKVTARITNAEELFILMQVNDILTRQGVFWHLYITYLMTMRMDRVMSFDRPYSLTVLANVINSFSCSNIGILEPHSDSSIYHIHCSYNIDGLKIKDDSNVVFPDKGALERFGNRYNVLFRKVRNLETGKIELLELAEEQYVNPNLPFVFYDDLCDGGGTFLGELEVLKKKYPNSVFKIVLCHAVNLEGIRKLCKAFDYVTITNSYRDWTVDEIEYDNIKIIDVC